MGKPLLYLILILSLASQPCSAAPSAEIVTSAKAVLTVVTVTAKLVLVSIAACSGGVGGSIVGFQVMDHVLHPRTALSPFIFWPLADTKARKDEVFLLMIASAAGAMFGFVSIGRLAR